MGKYLALDQGEFVISVFTTELGLLGGRGCCTRSRVSQFARKTTLRD